MADVEANSGVEETLDAHEQEMVDLVDDTAAKAVGQADPEQAPEYKEPDGDPKEEEIDYKAEYEKLLAEKDTPPEEDTKQPEGEADKTPTPPEDQGDGLVTPEVLGKYIDEFNGEGITEESYAEAKAAGYSKEVVDNYVAGQVAITQAQNQRVFAKTGGPEGYNEMISWAKDAWSPEQVSVFNDQVNSGDETQVMYGVDALTAQYKAANTGVPSRALKGSGGSGTDASSLGYADKSEMYKAMDNRLYGKDASYTNSVTKKIGLSKF